MYCQDSPIRIVKVMTSILKLWPRMLVASIAVLLGAIAALNPIQPALAAPDKPTSSSSSDETGSAPQDLQSAEFDEDTAQQFVDDYTKRQGLPGAAYVVTKDGEPVDKGSTGSVDVDTPMAIGSASKAFTAFAVLQLVDDGEVELDSPVTDYLPDFSVKGTDDDAITVRMLLSHTSGLTNPTFVPTTGSLEGDVASIADRKVAAEPGTEYNYSNLNYWTAALLVESISGKQFNSYMQDHIFEPLGMDDTHTVLQAHPIEGMNAGHVTAYGLSLPLPELRGDLGGAGGVISTAQDMGAWLSMQQRGGITADGERLLPQHLIEESHTIQPAAETYGFGWQHTSTQEPARVGHGGTMRTYGTRMDLVPTSGYGVAVLLDSQTPALAHSFELSTGLIEVSEGQTPEVRAPYPTYIDLGVGAVTILIALLGLLGARRSQRWADKRSHFPTWRFGLRLLPQLIMPLAAIVLFIGIPLNPQDHATALVVFGLWPAGMVLVLTAAAVGAVVTTLRVKSRADFKSPSDGS